MHVSLSPAVFATKLRWCQFIFTCESLRLGHSAMRSSSGDHGVLFIINVMISHQVRRKNVPSLSPIFSALNASFAATAPKGQTIDMNLDMKAFDRLCSTSIIAMLTRLLCYMHSNAITFTVKLILQASVTCHPTSQTVAILKPNV